jgi:hypothetical protein
VALVIVGWLKGAGLGVSSRLDRFYYYLEPVPVMPERALDLKGKCSKDFYTLVTAKPHVKKPGEGSAAWDSQPSEDPEGDNG